MKTPCGFGSNEFQDESDWLLNASSLRFLNRL
jgi:hypothetical protein